MPASSGAATPSTESPTTYTGFRHSSRIASKSAIGPAPIRTQNLTPEGGSERTANSDIDIDDDEREENEGRRVSSRIKKQAATAARDLAAKVVPSPSTSTIPRKRGRRQATKTPVSTDVSSRDTSPVVTRSVSPPKNVLNDPGPLSQLADVAAKAAKASPPPPSNPIVQITPTPKPNKTQQIRAQVARELLSSIDASGSADAVEVMVSDPSDRLVGYSQLSSWIDGGLDMYRHEFHPLLFPIFAHFYLDLIQSGFKDSALDLYHQHSDQLSALHTQDLHSLRSLLLPQHVDSSELAIRLRAEKYMIRMSRSGFSLFVGWLTEGMGGEAMGVGEGFHVSLEGAGRRARLEVLRVVNGRIRFDVTAAPTTTLLSLARVGSTGLLRSLVPTSTSGHGSYANQPKDPAAFNTAAGSLKLGPAPLTDALRNQVERALQDEANEAHADDSAMAVDKADGDRGTNGTSNDVRVNGAGKSSSLDISQENGTVGLTAPDVDDLLPSPSYRQVDIRRELRRVKDAQSRIRLGNPMPMSAVPKETSGNIGMAGPGSSIPVQSLPSVCAYTFHDASDGVNCTEISEDSSLMAAGFGESYIRLWSLKREKLRGLKSEFNSANVIDTVSLKKIRQKAGSTTRKLIGHSAPVYSVAFSTTSGTAGPPKHLLSASSDATTRLWSLETMSNLVAYRGHRNPIWDVQWAPGTGGWFATASRDRTARLWCTERIHAVRVFAGHYSDVDVLRFHPNGLYMATGSSDASCRLWDVQRGSCVRVFNGHSGPITSMALSPDGRYLASASTDLNINLFDLASGSKVKSMTGHAGVVNSLAFSACSSMLMSGGSDWTVRCWDVKSAGGKKERTARMTEGTLPEGAIDEIVTTGRNETVDLLKTFHTKKTPVINVQFTSRNLCLVSGIYQPNS